jgi:hypothetical protein
MVFKVLKTYLGKALMEGSQISVETSALGDAEGLAAAEVKATAAAAAAAEEEDDDDDAAAEVIDGASAVAAAAAAAAAGVSGGGGGRLRRPARILLCGAGPQGQQSTLAAILHMLQGKARRIMHSVSDEHYLYDPTKLQHSIPRDIWLPHIEWHIVV